MMYNSKCLVNKLMERKRLIWMTCLFQTNFRFSKWFEKSLNEFMITSAGCISWFFVPKFLERPYYSFSINLLVKINNIIKHLMGIRSKYFSTTWEVLQNINNLVYLTNLHVTPITHTGVWADWEMSNRLYNRVWFLCSAKRSNSSTINTIGLLLWLPENVTL